VQPEEALRLAEAYFGDLDAGDPIPPVMAPLAAPRQEEARLVLEDRVELPRIYMAWHSPALFAPFDAELDLVAEVLASGKTSRLYRALVFERRLATLVTVRQIAALYPYDNELLVIEGTGKMVKVALENAARFFSESGMPGFNYDMAKVWSMKSTAHSTKATAHATCVGTASRSRRSKSCASRCSQKCRRSDPARQAGRAFRWSLR